MGGRALEHPGVKSPPGLRGARCLWLRHCHLGWLFVQVCWSPCLVPARPWASAPGRRVQVDLPVWGAAGACRGSLPGHTVPPGPLEMRAAFGGFKDRCPMGGGQGSSHAAVWGTGLPGRELGSVSPDTRGSETACSLSGGLAPSAVQDTGASHRILATRSFQGRSCSLKPGRQPSVPAGHALWRIGAPRSEGPGPCGAPAAWCHHRGRWGQLCVWFLSIGFNNCG